MWALGLRCSCRPRWSFIPTAVDVQVDIVICPFLSLPDAHDIAETLQMKIESLDEVERCFVHMGMSVLARLYISAELDWSISHAQIMSYGTSSPWSTFGDRAEAVFR